MPRSARASDLKIKTGQRLRAAREALSLEQQDVYRAVNVGKSTWSMWETGQRLADPVAMVRFSSRFGISLDWIYRGDSSSLPEKIRKLVLFRTSSPEAGD